MNIRKDIRFRVYVAFTCICLFGAAILVKAVRMQVEEGPRLRAMAERMHTKTNVLEAERGNIYTEDNDLLCSTLPVFDVHIDFSVIDSTLFYQNVDTLAIQLASILKDKTPAAYRRELKKRYRKKDKNKYWLLCRKVHYEDFQALRGCRVFNKGQNRGGFIAESKTDRINPYKGLAYRTIGLYREDGRTVGLEAKYDSLLRGHEGSQVVTKMTGGVWMPMAGSIIEPRNGKDIVTTIDLDIQGIAEYAVEDMCKKFDLQYGTCVVMEVATGKVRALVNLGYQPDGSYYEDFNYAMLPTEPGSVFKLVTLTALLNDGYIKVSDMVDAEGGLKRFGNLTMRDSHLGTHKLTIKDAFAHSSNTAHGILAERYYAKNPERFIKQVKKLHLHEKTGIDLLGERSSVVKSPESKYWSRTTLPWMATGYEVQITPLHTCMLYNAVANDGKMMRPYLVSEVRQYGKTIYKKKPEVIEESIGDSATVAQLQACVEEVALTGTAKGIRSPFYSIAGKTGTAQVADRGIKYSDGVYQGSFVGYFPANEPRYTIAVVMRTKKAARTYYGGSIAAPVFKMVADRVFAGGKGWDIPTDSVAPSKLLVAQKAIGYDYNILLDAIGRPAKTAGESKMQQVVVGEENNKLIAQVQKIQKGLVPDVSGMGLKDAVFLLEREGLLVHIKGKGKVRAQSLAPGTLVKRGTEITLELNS